MKDRHAWVVGGLLCGLSAISCKRTERADLITTSILPIKIL